MKTSEILTQARALLSDPTRWTKGHMATDKLGISCRTTDTKAVCFCSLGAVDKVSFQHPSDSDAAITLLNDVVERRVGCRGLADFNDKFTTTHGDILAVFDAAIALAKEQA